MERPAAEEYRLTEEEVRTAVAEYYQTGEMTPNYLNTILALRKQFGRVLTDHIAHYPGASEKFTPRDGQELLGVLADEKNKQEKACGKTLSDYLTKYGGGIVDKKDLIWGGRGPFVPKGRILEIKKIRQRKVSANEKLSNLYRSRDIDPEVAAKVFAIERDKRLDDEDVDDFVDVQRYYEKHKQDEAKEKQSI